MQKPLFVHCDQSIQGFRYKDRWASGLAKGYYEHVVRSETDFRQIGEYIEHNAAKWKTDENYDENYVISVQKI